MCECVGAAFGFEDISTCKTVIIILLGKKRESILGGVIAKIKNRTGRSHSKD